MTDYDGGVIPLPKVLVSKIVSTEIAINNVQVYVEYTGDLIVDLSPDGGTTWENVAIADQQYVDHSFVNPGTTLMYRVLGLPGSVLSALIIKFI